MSSRGFSELNQERRREIARMGGLAVQAKGTGHQWTKTEAQAAGRKGAASRIAKKWQARAVNSPLSSSPKP